MEIPPGVASDIHSDVPSYMFPGFFRCYNGNYSRYFSEIFLKISSEFFSEVASEKVPLAVLSGISSNVFLAFHKEFVQRLFKEFLLAFFKEILLGLRIEDCDTNKDRTSRIRSKTAPGFLWDFSKSFLWGSSRISFRVYS